MTTSEDIAIHVKEVLDSAGIARVVWQRSSYEKSNEIVVVPHTSTGKSSIRTAIVKVNIHVPDIYNTSTKGYETNFPILISLKKQCISALERHVWPNTGINWNITQLDPPIKEQQYNEHFASITIEAHIRVKH